MNAAAPDPILNQIKATRPTEPRPFSDRIRDALQAANEMEIDRDGMAAKIASLEKQLAEAKRPVKFLTPQKLEDVLDRLENLAEHLPGFTESVLPTLLEEAYDDVTPGVADARDNQLPNVRADVLQRRLDDVMGWIRAVPQMANDYLYDMAQERIGEQDAPGTEPAATDAESDTEDATPVEEEPVRRCCETCRCNMIYTPACLECDNTYSEWKPKSDS